MPNDGMDLDDRRLCRTGGLAALAIGLGYFAIVGVYAPMGAPPHGADALLAYIAANTTAWRAIIWLSVVTDLLFLPVAIALHAVLKRFGRNEMLLAAACFALFVVLDLAVTWTNYAALFELSGRYAAVDEAQRAGLVAAAEYPAVVAESGLLFFYNTLILSVGILVAGWVMRKGAFSKSVAYLGVATGLLGVVSVVGPIFWSALSVAVIVASVFTMVWLLLVGGRLYRLGGLGMGG